MYDFEKDISFLNRYFVFQKVVTYDVEKITRVILEQIPEEYEFEERQTKAIQNAVKNMPKPKPVKLRKTLQLQEASEAIEEREQQQPVPIVAEKIPDVEMVEPDKRVEPEKKVEDMKKIKQRQTKKKTAAIQEETGDKPSEKKTATTRKKKNVDFTVIEE
jgi:hypothetical protein